MQKRFEVWALDEGMRLAGGDGWRIVATFARRKDAEVEAAVIRHVYKRVFVDFGYYPAGFGVLED